MNIVSKLLLVVGIGTMLAGAAHATPLRLVYDGYLSPGDTLAGEPLGAFTPFEVRADFDSNAPLLILEPGAAVYAPTTFTMSLQGVSYDVIRVQDDHVYGQGVVIFDKMSPDANSPAYNGAPHYGVGFFSLGGGNVGIIGDWLSASPEFTLGTLMATTFNSFYGVGYNDGPISLRWTGGLTTLQLNDPPDYNGTDPTLVFYGSNVDAPTIADNRAVIESVPEPRTIALLLGMLVVVGFQRWVTTIVSVTRTIRGGVSL